jgi:hypothetical protein
MKRLIYWGQSYHDPIPPKGLTLTYDFGECLVSSTWDSSKRVRGRAPGPGPPTYTWKKSHSLGYSSGGTQRSGACWLTVRSLGYSMVSMCSSPHLEEGVGRRDKLKLEFLDPVPKLLRFHMPGPAATPNTNKLAWWRKREEVYYRKRQKAFNPSSAIFGVQTWAIGLNRQKNWEQGTKGYIVKQFSHRYGLIGLMTGGASNLVQVGGLVGLWLTEPAIFLG